jgi:hypothetical protein
VFRDPRDRYVGFRAGLVTRPRDALTVPEFERLTGATTKSDHSGSGSGLRVAAARLARLLNDYGERILSGDESILEEAMALRREYTRPFTRTRSSNEQTDKKA